MVTQYQINQYVVVNESQNGFVNVNGRIVDIQIVNNVTRYLVRLDSMDGLFSLDDSMISPISLTNVNCKYKDGDVISFGTIDVLEKQVLIQLKFVSDEFDSGYGYVNVYIDNKYLFQVYVPLNAIDDNRTMLFLRYAIECGYKSGVKYIADIMKESFQRLYKI